MNIKNNSTDSIYGKINLPDSATDLIRNTLETHGEWAYLEALILKSMLSENDTIYDIGAYIGTFSLGLDKEHKINKIISVEPNYTSWKILTKNLENNCNSPFQTVNCSIGSKEGQAAEFSKSDSNLGARSYKEITPNPNKKQNIINQFTIQQLRKKYGSYNLLKLDIEGSECEALKGDAVWIKNKKPIIWSECNENILAQELLQFYLWAELSPIYISYPAFRKKNHKNSTSAPYPIAYEAAILGGSKERMDMLSTKNLGEEIICIPLDSYESLRKAMWLTPRWGQAEWINLSKTELIALIGRLSLNQDYKNFYSQK